jgi:kynurenine formamidase
MLAVAVGLVMLAVVGVSFMSAQQPAQPVNDKPLTERWAPTEWGPNDKAGSVNRTTPAMVMKAMRLVKQGKVATLGKLYHSSIPAFGARSWTMSIPGTPTGGPFGKNALIYHDEGFVCRGVLLDAPAYRGVKRLPIPKDSKSPGIVTAADVRAMVQRQGLAEIGEGDCVFLYTGHGDLWLNAEWKGLSPEEKAKRRDEFNSGEPGFGVSACEYMAQRKIILTGGDTSANDAQPGGEQDDFAVPCHTEMQTRRGIWNIENLEFTQLLKDKVYEFAFVWAPLKVVGGTGSPGNPVALY